MCEHLKAMFENRNMNACICVFEREGIYIHIYIYIHIHIDICINMCVVIHTYTCICTHMYVCIIHTEKADGHPIAPKDREGCGTENIITGKHPHSLMARVEEYELARATDGGKARGQRKKEEKGIRRTEVHRCGLNKNQGRVSLLKFSF